MDTPNLTCEYCKASVNEQTVKCPACGFPIGGTDVQKEIFYHQLGFKKESLKVLKDQIFRTRVLLWIIAGLSFLYAIFYFFSRPEDGDRLLVLILNVVIGGIFLLLSSYAEEKPFTALVIATVIFVALFMLVVIEGSFSVDIAFFTRIGIIAFLIKGAISARDADDLKKEMDKKKLSK